MHRIKTSKCQRIGSKIQTLKTILLQEDQVRTEPLASNKASKIHI